MSSSKPVGLLGVGLSLGLMTGAAWGASVYVNVVGASNVSLVASPSVVLTSRFSGAEDTYFIATPTDSPVAITAPTTAGNQVFSHWNGCNSASGTYLNTCNTTTASAFKQVTAIYTNADSRIVNISTRAYVGTGEKVVILGFMISGGNKLVRIRGLGPSLETSGIYDCLKDPHLTLYQGGTVIQTSDDSSIVNVISLRPYNATVIPTLESDINVTLAPGAYTAILQASPKTGFSTACPQSSLNAGIGLVSVEDQDQPTSPSRLVNISTRAYADLEGSSLQAIAGFVLSGTGKKRVFVKAAGPVLGQYGIVGPLQDPTVGFFSGANKTYSLDNWRDDPNFNSVVTVNASPLQDAESAFLMELSPGAYTVQMGASFTGYTQYRKMTGVGLISIEEDKGVAADNTPINTNLTTIYKRGVQCETTTYTVSGQILPASLLKTCYGFGIALCGSTDMKVYSASVSISDLISNLNAGWSTTDPSPDCRKI